MNTYAIFTPENGRILRIIGCPPQDLEMNVREGEAAFALLDRTVSDTTHRIVNGEIVELPQRPSPHHEWNWGALEWRPNLDSLRRTRLDQVKRELTRRLAIPVNYDGKSIDADATSQMRVTEKLIELEKSQTRGRPVASRQLVWRDAKNVIHTFPNVAAYETWLSGLLLAIGERNADLFAWSWAKKDKIGAATTFEELRDINLDLT